MTIPSYGPRKSTPGTPRARSGLVPKDRGTALRQAVLQPPSMNSRRIAVRLFTVAMKAIQDKNQLTDAGPGSPILRARADGRRPGLLPT
jgi:hypothetical protein